MSGQWPPEWEDSDTGLPDEWTDSGAGLPDEGSVDAGLDPEASAVTLFLASVPSPVLPAAFEARISAAIAAEATARADGTGASGCASADAESADAESAGTGANGTESAKPGMATAGTQDAKTTVRSSPPEFVAAAAESGSATAAKHRRRRTSAASRSAAGKSRPTGSRPDGRRRRLRMPSAAVTAPLLVLLVIAGFALVISQFGSSSSSSYEGTTAGPASSSGQHSSAAEPYGRSLPQNEPNLSGGSGRFVVTESGTRYQESTLASQVRQQLDALSPSALTPAPTAASPASSGVETPASAASAPIAPPVTLAGCVSHLTDGVTPRLVDRASYDGTAAYIIAVPSRVWVVRLGCTAADPQEITSVSLTGLSGNLSALGSVKGYASSGERRMQ
jgi:hypothetical protein